MFKDPETLFCAFIAFVVVVGILFATGFFEAAAEAFDHPQPVSKQQQLEDLCVSGNANACQIYQVRYEKRCIL